MRMILTFLRVAHGRLRNMPVTIEMLGGRSVHLAPDGRVMPLIAGGDGGDGSDPGSRPSPDPPVEPERKPTREDIERLNRENAKHRKEAKAAREEAERLAVELKKRDDGENSDLERAQTQAVEAKKAAEAARQKVRDAKVLAALADRKHGIVSPSAAAKLIDGVLFDAEDEPVNLAERIEMLLDDNSFLKASAQIVDPSSPANPGRVGEPKEVTADEAKRLARENPDVFNKKFEAGEIPTSALGA